MSSLFAVGTRPDASMLGLTEKAAALGRERRLPVIAVCFWPELNGWDAAALAGCGAERIIHVALEPGDVNSEPTAVELLEELTQRFEPEGMLFLNSVFMGAVAPALAAGLGCGMTADCTGLCWSPEGTLLQTRPTFGGQKLATIENTCGIALATVRKGAFPASGRCGIAVSATVERIDPANKRVWRLQKVLDRFGAGELADARLILAGGLGLGSKENFKKLELLAKAVGASVGASRAAVAAGFASYQHQVGQTGVSVQPELYCAFGISGAVQHLSGITGAKRIYAVNRDPNAPIHAYADYSLVADCGEVLDALCRRFCK